MKLFGIDFTSAPTSRKPITCASGNFKIGRPLIFDSLEIFANYTGFEQFLKRKGPWLAGMDSPMGLPLSFLHHLKLSTDWSSYVRTIGNWDKNQFESKISSFKNKRPKGLKEPLRATDAFSGAKSPLKLVNPPLGKMFYETAPRLLRSGVSVIPCLPKKDNRVILESYPALMARMFVKKYKSEDSKSTSLRKAREVIVNGIGSVKIARQLGFLTQINPRLKTRALEDFKGDVLDAFLCTIQVAWAYSQRKNRYGIPYSGNEQICAEGWIINPYLNP